MAGFSRLGFESQRARALERDSAVLMLIHLGYTDFVEMGEQVQLITTKRVGES